MMIESPIQLDIFISFAEKDEALLRELETHLSQLRRRGTITLWHFQQTPPGENVEQAINEHLELAHIILLLISPDFLNSDACYTQMQRALERRHTNEALVIPLVLRPCDWTAAPCATLPCLPVDGKPITTWDNPDAAWNEVVLGLRHFIDPTTPLPERKTVNQEQAGSRTNWIANYGPVLGQVNGENATVHMHFHGITSTAGSAAPDAQNQRFSPPGELDWQKRLPLARDLRTESFMLGDPEQFPYVRAPVQAAYLQATEALREASEDGYFSQQAMVRGIFVVGESNAGKTRFAVEVLKETLPAWPVLRWQADFTRDMFPPIASLSGKKLVLFLDDLQDYVLDGMDTDGRLIPGPDLRTLYNLLTDLLQHVRRLIIFVTCRREYQQRVQAHGRLNTLSSQLKEIVIPSFSINAHEGEAKEIIDEFQKYGPISSDDWDGTLGSLVLGLSVKKSQYLSLPRSARGILQAMKLLFTANILPHTEQRLRALCAGIFAERDVLEDDRVWKDASALLIQMQMVREIVNENTLQTELRIRKDSYFEKVVSDYPASGRPQQIVQDLAKLPGVFRELKDAPALLHLGIMYINQKQYGLAKDSLLSALQFEPTLSSGWFYLGVLYLVLGENEQARKANDRAVEYDGRNDLAHYNRGVALFQLHRYKDALKAIERALALNPHLTFAIVTQAKTLLALHNWTKALEVLDTAIANAALTDTRLRIDMLMEKAGILSQLERPQEELAAYLQVLALDDTSFTAAFQKAAILSTLGEHEQALLAYDYALQLNPHDIDIWNNRALVLKDMGRFAEAEQGIEDALKRDPYNGELWDSKGEILLAQKRYQEAVEAYHQAVQCSPQNKTFRRNAAAALQQLKESQRSRSSDRMKEAKHTRSDNNSRK